MLLPSSEQRAYYFALNLSHFPQNTDRYGLHCYPEDGGNRFLRNVSTMYEITQWPVSFETNAYIRKRGAKLLYE